jgi:CheY-like chemotaxis protein
VSKPEPVVLLVARDGLTHKLLTALLQDECTFLGARTVAAALQLVRGRAPDVVLLDDSFEDLPGLMTTLTGQSRTIRTIVLAQPNRPGTRLAQLAVLGPVVTKPIDNIAFKSLVLSTAHLTDAGEVGAEQPTPSVPSYVTTRVLPVERGTGK